MNSSHQDGAARLRGLKKLFGDLKVRPKLMVLHNIFFLALVSAVYLSLIPPFRARLDSAETRETGLVAQAFSGGKYPYREGPARALGIPPAAQRWLDAHPGATWSSLDYLYRREPGSALYRRVNTPHSFYLQTVNRARWSLLAALGAIYLVSVLALELLIMPTYVYRPLRLMLAADRATQRGDQQDELIDPGLIPGDEIGQIMASRNATVAELRRHEESLARALVRLEEVNQDLQRKNYLLETARKNLADQDRLVSLGMMSASVAHELNTPLAVLHGSIEKLIETVEDRAAQERLARMIRVTRRLQRISESLLDFARVRRREMEPLAIYKVIDEAWALVAIDEKAGAVRFSNGVARDHLVTGNSDRLIQVFVNLLRNALNVVESGGEVSVHSREFEEGARRWVAVAVEDNGPGIPADVLPHIFEAFVTSRLDSRGTGLGLTVAEGIVHQHGGAIEASNRSGGGASVEVRLPAGRPS